MSRKYVVTSRVWDSNGTAWVTVESPWPRTHATDQGARRAARASDPMGQTRHASIHRVELAQEPMRLVYTVRATRLES